MNPIYNLGIACYATAVRLVSGKNVKAKKMLIGHKQTFDILKQKLDPSSRYLWVHVASLGEFEQGRPFIEMVKREMPHLKILLTFFSPSGYEVRKNYPEADIICYLPFDTRRNAKRFVEMVRPVAAVFVKYEFWRNYLHALRRIGTPTFIISAIFRPRQSFFKWWGGMFRRLLRYYQAIFVQDDRSAQLLKNIGIENVVVAGDTRFDRVTDIMRSTHSIEGIDDFCKHSPLTMVVGSSWEADEDIYIPWLAKHPEVRCIVAPHEFNPQRLAALRQRLGKGTMLMSEIKENPALAAEARHIIVDCFGLLSSLYRYGDIAYVGGGFGAGIHNINEAAVYGIPVVFGPNHKKFKEAIDLIECGGALTIDGADSYDKSMAILLDEEDRHRRGKYAADYISSHLGATEKVFTAIRPCLEGK